MKSRLFLRKFKRDVVGTFTVFPHIQPGDRSLLHREWGQLLTWLERPTFRIFSGMQNDRKQSVEEYHAIKGYQVLMRSLSLADMGLLFPWQQRQEDFYNSIEVHWGLAQYELARSAGVE